MDTQFGLGQSGECLCTLDPKAIDPILPARLAVLVVLATGQAGDVFVI